MLQRVSSAALLLALLMPTVAEAMVLRSGEEVVIPKGEIIRDDLYVAGQDVRIDGTVLGDLVVAGGDVVITGSVRDDLIAIGGNVSLDGSVGQSVRALGGKVRVEGAIAKDAMVAGGTLTFGPASTIRGDALLAGGEVDLGGSSGAIRAAASTIRLAGRAPSVDAAAGRLVIESSAKIKGPLSYRANTPAEIPEGAVTGPVSYVQAEESPTRGFPIALWLWFLMASAFTGALLAALMPRIAGMGASTLLRRPVASLVVGLGLSALLPGAFVTLAITVIGIPLALLILSAFPPLFFVSWLLSGAALGYWIRQRFARPMSDRGARALEAFIGVVILAAVLGIPFLGFLLMLVGGWMGLGALCLNLDRSQRQEYQKVEELPSSNTSEQEQD